MSSRQPSKPVPPALADVFSAAAEGLDLEFKSARGGLPGSFWETYSAMANAEGGCIVLGVAEKDGALSWDGVADAGVLRTLLWNQLNDRNKVSVNLLRDADIDTLTRDGRQFVSVRVPRATRGQRPVHIGPNPLTGTYRRAEEGDYRCSEDEVRRMLADQSSLPADAQVVEHFDQRDFDADSVRQYRNRFASRDPDHPWLSEDDAGLLFKLGALRRERSSGMEGATVAGLLMFGSFEALREALPSYHVDYRERLSADPAVRWTDRLVPDGTWPGNVFQFQQRVVQRLSADLRIPFQLDRSMYRRDDTIVHEAVREAVVNALIHADHRGQGGVVIERYPDRIELSNPGTLLVSREQLLRGGVSECRNKSLQLMFQMIGSGEKAGSGMDKIRAGWATQHWRSPKVEETYQPDRVRLVLPMVSLIPETVERELRERFGDRFSRLDPLAVQAVVTARMEGSVSNARMQEIAGEHPADITAALQQLVRDGLLAQRRQGRWASYSVGEEVPPLAPDFPHSEADFPHSAPVKFPHCGLDSPQTASSVAQDPLLMALAAPARARSRLPRPELEALVVALCNGRWLNRHELGTLLGRDPDHLQSRILTGMVRAGKLQLRFPDVPNRPDQAYRAR